MTDDAAVVKAANWLRVTAKKDEDVRTALFNAYRKHEVTNISELARDQPQLVLDLCEAMQEMFLDVDAMNAHDDELRGVWKSD